LAADNANVKPKMNGSIGGGVNNGRVRVLPDSNMSLTQMISSSKKVNGTQSRASNQQ